MDGHADLGWTRRGHGPGWSLARALAALVSCVGRAARPAVGSTRHPPLSIPNPPLPRVLEALPRIGPALAGRIVEAREQAPFVDVADFDRRVKGIGPATIAAIRPYSDRGPAHPTRAGPRGAPTRD